MPSQYLTCSPNSCTFLKTAWLKWKTQPLTWKCGQLNIFSISFNGCLSIGREAFNVLDVPVLEARHFEMRATQRLRCQAWYPLPLIYFRKDTTVVNESNRHRDRHRNWQVTSYRTNHRCAPQISCVFICWITAENVRSPHAIQLMEHPSSIFCTRSTLVVYFASQTVRCFI